VARLAHVVPFLLAGVFAGVGACQGAVDRIYYDDAQTEGGTVGPSGSGFAVGGSVTGLQGKGLVLQNNFGDDLTVESGAASFVFTRRVERGAPYSVSIKSQPADPTQTCTLGGASGTVDATDVTSVTVTCATNAYSVGANVTGLPIAGDAGAPVLQNNGRDDITLLAAGGYTFKTQVVSGDPFKITVLTQPTGGRCVVAGGAGIMRDRDVVAEVSCLPSYIERFTTAPGDWPVQSFGPKPWARHNDIFGSDGNVMGADCCGATGANSTLTSKAFNIAGDSGLLTFWHLYDTEVGHDGGVLEISIGSEAFQDILVAGGKFAENGYTGALGAGTDLSGRQAFTGKTGNVFIRTVVNLPARAARQAVKFRWRYASDNATASTGWYLDTVQVDP